MDKNGKYYSDYVRYQRINGNRFSGYNGNINEPHNNENTIDDNQSQFCHDIIIVTVLNYKCDDATGKPARTLTLKIVICT